MAKMFPLSQTPLSESPGSFCEHNGMVNITQRTPPSYRCFMTSKRSNAGKDVACVSTRIREVTQVTSNFLIVLFVSTHLGMLLLPWIYIKEIQTL